MLEKYLIEHCSPTLASLKTANLFTYRFESKSALENTLSEWNETLKDKGIRLTILRESKGSALIYVYRSSALARDLSFPEVSAFLKQYGYHSTETEYAIARLSLRLSECESFPHEIGLFLGYPLGDVTGFIENHGDHCKCCGYWKVYCDEQDALRKFAKYKKCLDVYVCLWNKGRSVRQLTVAA